MLWHKAWVDTRWRFFLGLALLLVLACGSSLTFPRVRDFVASMQLPVVADKEAAAALRESLGLMSTFRGYAWSQWFAQNFPALLTLLAALLGSGSPLVKAAAALCFRWLCPCRVYGGSARVREPHCRAFVLALVPGVAFAVLAPLVGERFALTEALAYGLSAFVGGSLFLGLAVFLSTLFTDVWRPVLLTCVGALAIGMLTTL